MATEEQLAGKTVYDTLQEWRALTDLQLQAVSAGETWVRDLAEVKTVGPESQFSGIEVEAKVASSHIASEIQLLLCFDSEHKQILLEVNKGDTIDFIGKVDKVEGEQVDVVSCEMIKVVTPKP